MSINRITYLSELKTEKFFLWSDYLFTHLLFSDIIEVTQFLRELEKDTIYVVTLELIIAELNGDVPCITLCNPILITKNSNPKLISKFILNQISLADYNFDLNYDLLMEMRLSSVPCVLLKYNQINIF
jgi:hypothetical protein